MREDLQGIEQNVRTIIIFGTIVFLMLGAFIIFFIGLYRYRKNKMLQEKEMLQAQFQQTLLQSQLEIQEQTLKIISQEIHDNIGQVLSLAKLQLGTIDIGQTNGLQEKISDSRQLVSKAIRDLRDLSHTLDADQVMHIGLLRALEMELEQIRKAGIYEAVLKIAGTPYRIDSQTELILFRIAQEALHNVLKHADATIIHLSFEFSSSGIQLLIMDNGKGFTVAQQDTRENTISGAGIRNMHHRASLIGATFSVNCTQGNGTTVSIYLKNMQPN